MKKINIVGCGLSGITAAALLKDNHHIKIFDTRNHIGGNCADIKVGDVLVHQYGPHIFHTDDEEVFEFLSKYTEWFDFKYQPKANTNLGMISLPYSKKTINEIGRELSQEEIVEYIFKDYSEKQWGVPFDEIPSTITNRIPKTKDCDDPTWFEGQKYQCIPKQGYTKMFENMLEGVDVYLNSEKDEWRNHECDLVIYTGKIDEYYEYCYGELPYRTLDFKNNSLESPREIPIINECNMQVAHTRSYDHSVFNFEYNGSATIVTEEYPRQATKNDIPFYPIPFGDGNSIYKKYEEMSKNEQDIIFMGRLAQYKYLDMWMAVKHVMLKLKKHV
jgi:UDP-galactopyranose mutase